MTENSNILFISKKVTDKYFLDFCASKNYQLVDQSMIRFKDLNFITPNPGSYEVIFFSSKRAVDFFLAKVTPESHHLIACIGSSTAKSLEKWGLQSDFTPEKSGHPETVSKQFECFVGDRTVLFPQSNISQQSMQKQLDNHRTINIVVYETHTSPIKLVELPSVIVFTSPSNVRAYLQMNTINQLQQKIIAWGNTTASYLKQSNVEPDYTLSESSLEELVRCLRYYD